MSLHRSIMDNAAAAWQPWLTEGKLKELDTAQNNCLRAITGQYACSNLESLRLNAGVTSYQTHSKQLTLIAYEKGMRMPKGHPRRDALDKPRVVHRSKQRSSFRAQAESILQPLSIHNAPREPITLHFPEPWRDPPRNWSVQDNQDIKANIPTLKQRIECICADVVIYTDGSCTGGVANRGAAAIISDGNFDTPAVIDTKMKKGNRVTCSHREEHRALNLGLDWLDSARAYETVLFCTDSLSLLQAINNESADTAKTREKIQRHQLTSFHLLYVPGHKDIPGNEIADQKAKEAAKLPGEFEEEISLSAAKSVIRKEIRDPPPVHRITQKYAPHLSLKTDEQQLKTRKENTTVAQLRSGHIKGLAYYDALVDRSGETTSECKRCMSGEIDDVEHWLTRCAQTEAARQKIFGTTSVDMAELGRAPTRIYELYKKTLLQSRSEA